MRIYLIAASMSLLLAVQAQLARAMPEHELVLVQDSIDLMRHDLPRIEAESMTPQDYPAVMHAPSNWIDRPYPGGPKFRSWPRVRYVYHHVRIGGQRYRLAALWSIKPPKRPRRKRIAP